MVVGSVMYPVRAEADGGFGANQIHLPVRVCRSGPGSCG